MTRPRVIKCRARLVLLQGAKFINYCCVQHELKGFPFTGNRNSSNMASSLQERVGKEEC